VSLADASGLALSTTSTVARDAYVDAVERLLCAQPGIEAALARALEADPRFALAHAALARAHQAHARGPLARASMATAVELAADLGERERGHVMALARVVAGDAAGALAAIRAHLDRHPRDVLVMAPCGGVFGLFGFSGLAGRERALDAFLEQYVAECDDHWWFQATRAFAQCELGELDAARANIERSLASQPHNANGAHIRAHVDYESGEDAAGLAWLQDWCEGYSREGFMHCHLHWHVALSALELGDTDAAWASYASQVAAGAAWGPPLNLLTDGASFLLRAELAGQPRFPERWRTLAAYARECFPNPGVAFADAHAALAFAMAGDAPALARLRVGACGPAADVVVALADGFAAFAQQDHRAVVRALAPLMATHERIGGSRAQRDLIEYVMLAAQRRGGGDGGWVRRRGRALPAGMRVG
jgi:tetratricopeptide (TPR) repeat protein